MDIREVEKDILNDLNELEDTISQYTYLISCADYCEELPEEYRQEQYLVKECQVNTWMYVPWQNDTCTILADSESLIVKGALALLQELYHGRTREEIGDYQCSLLEHEIFSKHFTTEQRRGLEGVIYKLKTT